MRRLHEADISRRWVLPRRAGAHARCLPPQVRRWQTRRVRTVPQRGCRASGRFRRRGPANVCRLDSGTAAESLANSACSAYGRPGRPCTSCLQTPLLSAWATLHLLLLTPAGLLRLRAGKAGSPWLRAAKKAAGCSRRIISSRSCAGAPCSPAAGSCRTRAYSSPIVPYASTCSRLGMASSPSTYSSAGTGAKPSPPCASSPPHNHHTGACFGARQPPPHALSRCVRRRIHKECLLKIKKRRTPSGAVRMCPLCRVASRTKHTFKLRGEMA